MQRRIFYLCLNGLDRSYNLIHISYYLKEDLGSCLQKKEYGFIAQEIGMFVAWSWWIRSKYFFVCLDYDQNIPFLVGRN
jgi:hypothetical protein